MRNITSAITLLLVLFSNSAAQWTKIGATGTQNIVALAVSGDTIFAASRSNLLYRSTDNGITWTSVIVSNETITTTTLDVIDKTIYIGTYDKGIFYSNDNGLTWMRKGDILLYVSGIEKRGNNLYAATLGDGVFVFDQNSKSWLPFNNSLPNYSVNVFTILNTPGSLLIGAGANGTYYRYNFNNNEWIEEYYYGIYRPGLIIDKLIGDSNTLFAVNGNRIIRSDNGGLNWTDDKSGTHNGGDRNISSGVESFYTITNLLSGGTWIQQRDKLAPAGYDWSATEEFLPEGYSWDILEFNDILLLARADGLYIKDIIPGTGNPEPGKSEIKIYPNPSNGSGISISSDNQIHMLSIINMLGKIKYSEVVDNSHLIIHPVLERGIYYINLIMTDGPAIVKKIIIQ